MKIGIVGLGRMGAGIAERLLAHHHEVMAFNRHSDKLEPILALGGERASTYSDFAHLPQPRIVWVMVPAGDATEEVIFGNGGLADTLQSGDIIIDGGNSKYTDTMERGHRLKAQGIELVDCGTSGGLGGRTNGYCIMVGGSKESYLHVVSILKVIAQPGGLGHFGPTGAGHYVKMVHNGIEYGMMQSIAEGLNLLKNGQFKGLDLEKLIDVWQHGSIVQSYLVGLTQDIFAANPELEGIEGYVAENGEGRWTVEAAEAAGIPVPSIKLSLDVRSDSRAGKVSDTTRFLAAMRQLFGGHSIDKPN
jgi:6-phosphogluconate dehydrogenase